MKLPRVIDIAIPLFVLGMLLGLATAVMALWQKHDPWYLIIYVVIVGICAKPLWRAYKLVEPLL